MPLSTIVLNGGSDTALLAILMTVLGGLKMENRPMLNAGWYSKMKGHVVTNSFALAFGGFLSFWEHSPENVGAGSIAATSFIVIDTIFGIACACIFKEFRSRTLRERLVAKFIYYALFIFSSYILGALLKAYWMIAAPWYAICLIELSSIGETLTRLHIKGGKKFGPAEKILAAMASAMGQAAQSTLPNDSPDAKRKGKGE